MASNIFDKLELAAFKRESLHVLEESREWFRKHKQWDVTSTVLS